MAEDRSQGHFFKSLYQKQPRVGIKGALQDPKVSGTIFNGNRLLSYTVERDGVRKLWRWAQ